MSTVTQTEAFVAPTFGSLLRAELLRVRSRRFVTWSGVVLFLIMLLVSVVYFNTTEPYSQAEVDRAVALCTANGGAGAGDPSGDFRPGGACDVRDAVSVGAFPNEPPAYRAEIADWAAAIGVAAAAFGFILGATFGGADWAQRTMPALLFWEPRRTRVYLAKVLALCLGVTAFFVLAQLVWAVLSAPTLLTHGVWDDGSGSLLEPLISNLGRTWLLAMVFATIGYGIASLTRNTGAALGAGFVYFAIFETFIGIVFSRAQEWLLLVNIAALLTPGGIAEDNSGGDFITISSQRGALVLIGYAVIINTVAYLLFRRRDIT
jgi:ABC-type transport system involved in multi-copper enzyme maturation permease subunit